MAFYISQPPSQRLPFHPHAGMATHYLRRALRGTGDSDFRSLLKEALKSTQHAALPATLLASVADTKRAH